MSETSVARQRIMRLDLSSRLRMQANHWTRYALPGTYGAPVDVPRRELDMILSNYVYLSAENIVKSDNTLDAIVKQIEKQSNKS